MKIELTDREVRDIMQALFAAFTAQGRYENAYNTFIKACEGKHTEIASVPPCPQCGKTDNVAGAIAALAWMCRKCNTSFIPCTNPRCVDAACRTHFKEHNSERNPDSSVSA